MDTRRRSWAINIIGTVILVSNLLLVFFYVLPTAIDTDFQPPKIISTLSSIAVFPLDFYHAYLRELLLASFAWILIMFLCGLGILLLNRFARDVFIVLNIIHVIILAILVVLRFRLGYLVFVDFFFKLYFTMVASGAYVGFLTIPDVREQFRVGSDEAKVRFWFLKSKLQQAAPKDPMGYFNLGVAYARLNRLEDAVAALGKAISIKPDRADFHHQLGLVLFKKKKYPEAVKALQEAVRLDPLKADGHYHLGLIYENQGCGKEAVAAFERCLHAQPETPRVYAKLGKAYASAARYEEALQAFEKCIQLNPADEDAYFQMGKILVKHLEKYKEAEQAFHRAVQLNADFIEAHFEAGMVAVKMSRYKDAVRAFKEVLRIEDQHIPAHYQLGFTYAMLQDYDSARREMRVLKNLDPDLAASLAMVIK